MSFINYVAREIHCKIIYYGPPASGKSANLRYVHSCTAPSEQGGLLELTRSLRENSAPTVFFDFLPLSVGEVRGYQTRFHLYSLPAHDFYDLSRQFILKGVDGIIYVADSQSDQLEANLENFGALEKSLHELGYDLQKLPLVFQYNKRDMPKIVPVRDLELTFNPLRKPHFEAVASQGAGVMESLQTMSQLILHELKGGPT